MFPGLTYDLLDMKQLLKYRNEDMRGLAKFIDGGAEELDVNIEEGAVRAIYHQYTKAKMTSPVTESDVQSHILYKLNDMDKCKVSISPKTECRMSQFSGGGDIEIKIKSQQATIDFLIHFKHIISFIINIVGTFVQSQAKSKQSKVEGVGAWWFPPRNIKSYWNG